MNKISKSDKHQGPRPLRASQTSTSIITYLSHTVGVSQCRVKLLQSHYFKHATSSSAAEVLFQYTWKSTEPGVLRLEKYRGCT